MKKWLLCFMVCLMVLAVMPPNTNAAGTTLTIATVNNPDMVVMQGLSAEFTKQTGIELQFVVLPGIFVTAMPHPHSKAYQKTFGTQSVCFFVLLNLLNKSTGPNACDSLESSLQ